MKRIAIALLCILALYSSCSNRKMDPSAYLSEKEQMEFKMELCRYLEKLPPRTSLAQRWDSSVAEYYRLTGEAMNLVKLYKNESGYYYFYVTRIVPSVREGERRAEAGKCLYENGKIKNIEEFLFSVVAAPEVLEAASDELFPVIVKTDKAPENNALVEWPNEYFYYDKAGESWDRRPATTK